MNFEYTLMIVEGVGVPVEDMNAMGQEGWAYIDSHNLPGGERGFLFERQYEGPRRANLTPVLSEPTEPPSVSAETVVGGDGE